MYKIYKPANSKNWYCEINISGQRIRKSLETKEKTLAEAAAKALHDQVYRQLKTGRTIYTWAHAVVAYKKAEPYQLSVLSPYFADGQMHLTAITQSFIKNTLDDLQVRRGLKDSSRNRYAQMIRAILMHAHKKIEDDNGTPMLERVPYIEILPEDTARDRWLTPREACLLITELPQHLADMASFTLYTGLRAENVLGLRWEWIDLVRRVAVIPADVTKAKKPIPVYLTAEAHAVLLLRAEDGQSTASGYVFTYHGNRITRTHNHAWNKALQRAGLDDVRWHDLRRTWASWHAQQGTTLEQLMRLGGWASIEILRKHYAHLAPEQLREIAENISSNKKEVKP